MILRLKFVPLLLVTLQREGLSLSMRIFSFANFTFNALAIARLRQDLNSAMRKAALMLLIALLKLLVT